MPRAFGQPGRRVAEGRAGSGGALLELLLATALFSVALLALAPLFMRAATDVRSGGSRSEAAVLGSGLIGTGSPPDLAFYARDEGRWRVSAPAPPDRAIWVASTTIRHYPLDALDDGRLEPAEALTELPEEPELLLVEIEARLSRTVGGRVEMVLRRLDWESA